MNRKYILWIAIWGLLFPAHVRAQGDGIADTTGALHYGLSAMAIATSNDQVPFWMRSNQYGSIPLSGLSASISGYAKRDYAQNGERKRTDWGAAVEGRFNMGNRAQFILLEAYVKARLSIFQVKAGRSRDIMGIADPLLSSGNFAVSGNALGIPKAALSVPDYWAVPYTKGVVSLKGNFAIGYIGKIPTEQNLYMPGIDAETYFHQKSLYGRLGKDSWRVKLYGGFNHQVFWGNENLYFDQWNLSPLRTTLKAITGTVYKGSKVGNHLGSVDQGIEITLKQDRIITAYHQFFYDVGGLYHLNNIRDGLWGISLKRKDITGGPGIGWHKVLLEFFNSKSQGGQPDAKITPSGDENYYNGMYMEGWTYRRANLGSPLLTNRDYMRAELPGGIYNDFIVNNRVVAIHGGLEGFIHHWSVILKGTYSMNYGTYGSSPWGHSNLTIRNPGPPPYFLRVNQFSASIEASRPMKNGFHVGFVFAGDYGDLLYHSAGGVLKLTKAW